MYDFNKIFNPDRKAQYKCPDELEHRICKLDFELEI